MFMVTKTLTIMEDAYNLLKMNKLKGESFSEVIRRIVTKRKKGNLMDIFGIISEEDGEAMLKDLEKAKKFDLKMQKERMKW